MFRTIIKPRVSETDGAGHINNTTIPIWLEGGRDEVFRMFMPNLSFENWKLVIVNIHVDYLHQLYYGREVEVLTYVQEIGNTSFKLYEEIYQSRNRCVRGSATYVNYNLATNQSEPIPQKIRQQLEQHMYDKEKTK
ncbi:acyl-CoA thioesterase [Neobacillus muris]|uniref:acyl-CoA thioesterase n=1 Tax=Neobacillus muris TaxID=2941334 RepID=UPI00203CBFB3|nr:thioesterase family protein [Neobacillus muris]